MSSDLVRYLAAGGGTITLCGCIARVISLMMRLKFNRYVVDRAVEQGQPIDPLRSSMLRPRKPRQNPRRRSRRLPHRRPCLRGSAVLPG